MFDPLIIRVIYIFVYRKKLKVYPKSKYIFVYNYIVWGEKNMFLSIYRYNIKLNTKLSVSKFLVMVDQLLFI